jgi:hypothetical protein
VARQDVADAAVVLHCSVQRVDGRAGHAERTVTPSFSSTRTAASIAFILAMRVSLKLVEL